jgi:uncharacterized protein
MKIIRIMVLSLLLSIHGLALGGFEEGAKAYNRGDYGTALREWRPLAEQGNADAQLNMGFMYDNGYGVPQDYKKAITWYRRAAEQDNKRAQYNLGLMYDMGYGVPQNKVQAHMWYDIASVPVALDYRDRVARELTMEQVADAQRLASEWIGKYLGRTGETRTRMATR